VTQKAKRCVIPAQAGIQLPLFVQMQEEAWVPAFAGMTE
jgi:hypothetical protein